jgi:hypothetical protein
MADSIVPLLRSLRDIEGVLGSFLIGEGAQLLGRDIPAACGSDVLFVVGGRLQQLCDAFVSADIGGSFESTTLSFPQYKLHVRALGNLFLVAVLSAEANMPALRMAMNMVGRRIVTLLSAAPNEPVSAPAALGTSPRAAAAPPAAESHGDGSARSYRGQRFSG